MALCTEIEGLFVDLPPRPRERFTLIGCTPDGALADLLHRLPVEALGTEQAWLGDISVTAPAPPPDTAPSWWGEDLGDVVVLARRPNTTMPDTVDIDLDGFVHLQDRTEGPDDVDEFVLPGPDEAPYGTCRDVTGVFREHTAPPVPQVRRLIHAEVPVVAADGSADRAISAVVSGTISAGEPSRLGAGLLDVTVDSNPREPLPAGTLHILEQWRTGRPPRKNSWAGHDRQLRHQWAGVALGHRTGMPDDRPPGTTYHLDGRFVTDIEGFYCAIGEAINDPRRVLRLEPHGP